MAIKITEKKVGVDKNHIENKDYTEFKLSNGLLVILKEISGLKVSGILRIWHGALNEKKGEEGIAHFLEHTLLTGGSKKYNLEKSDSIKGKFGYFNAFTSLNNTVFMVDMLAEDTPLFLEYVSDTAFNPKFDKKRVEEERQRVLREIADQKSNPLFKDRNMGMEVFYGKNSPQVYNPLGKESVVMSASIRNLKDFHKRGYYPNNMYLILVGALPRNITESIKKNFSKFKSGNYNKVELPRNKELAGATILHTKAPELYNHENPKESSAQLIMSFFAPTKTDEDSYAVSILSKILGWGPNSRLFVNVSQRKGLAYGISATYDGENNHGDITISGSVHSARADESIDSIFEEMNKLRKELISQECLEGVKRMALYEFANKFETTRDQLNALDIKLDNGLTPEHYLQKLKEVTPEKVREVAIKYLPQNRKEGKYVLLLRDPLKK